MAPAKSNFSPEPWLRGTRSDVLKVLDCAEESSLQWRNALHKSIQYHRYERENGLPISIAILLILFLALSSAAQQVLHFTPTSEVVRVASMAARDEGYNPDAEGTYLDELRTVDGKEPIKGYTSIGLYKDGHIVRSYSIRVETGDVVDATVCKIFRYPDLLSFKRKLMKDFGTKEASLDLIESEVGCDKLRIVPAKAAAQHRHS